jgi:hypothetical protein
VSCRNPQTAARFREGRVDAKDVVGTSGLPSAEAAATQTATATAIAVTAAVAVTAAATADGGGGRRRPSAAAAWQPPPAIAAGPAGVGPLPQGVGSHGRRFSAPRSAAPPRRGPRAAWPRGAACVPSPRAQCGLNPRCAARVLLRDRPAALLPLLSRGAVGAHPAPVRAESASESRRASPPGPRLHDCPCDSDGRAARGAASARAPGRRHESP